MLGRRMLIAAGAMYLLVVGCALWPTRDARAKGETRVASANGAASSDVATTPLTGLPYRGAAMQIQRVDWIDKYEQSMDEIADRGLDTVLLVVDTRQENGTSARIYLDMRMTPTPEQLSRLIKHAKSRNLRVILMPVVLLDKPIGNEWRGTIKPAMWDDWFDSYREMITHFAWIAEGNGVNVLVVGSELVSTEGKTDEWTKTIKAVRAIFKGQLTYSSNWDHYTAVTFWNQLDLIGMNSYWKLGKDRHATVSDITDHWRAIQSDLIPFLKKEHKPLLFLEVGWCSLANAAHEPWDYTKDDEDVDLDLQKRLYEGFFQSWYGNEHLGGFMIWQWTPGDGGPNDKGYTPENKPAEKVLEEWVRKPRWEVK